MKPMRGALIIVPPPKYVSIFHAQLLQLAAATVRFSWLSVTFCCCANYKFLATFLLQP